MWYLTYCVLFLALIIITYKLSKKNTSDIKVLGQLSLLVSTIYLIWRIFFTIPSNNFVSIFFGIVLVLFELLGFMQSVVLRFLFSTKNKVLVCIDKPFLKKPTVDIFICTYNEPISILKRTIINATMVNYPKNKLTVYVGDDGRRKDVEKLCKKYKVKYITREDNKHAKAGNLNNLLNVSRGDYILVLDADFIPKQNIIEKMLPYFEDSKMGFVQVPQVFYNLDPYQYNLGFDSSIPNEQEFFMRSISKKRSNINATLQLGTNTLFYRQALLDIGGVPTGSITEDMATGMLIQNAGYKSYYLNECLAIGLAVESFEDYIKQRDRWARGNLQVMQKYKPFSLKNLNWKQKLVYWAGSLYWLFGIQKMVYITFPMLYLIGGITIFQTDALMLFSIFLPSYIGSLLYYKKVSNSSRSMLWSNIYETSVAPRLAWSVIKEWFFSNMKKLKFAVTPKGKLENKSSFHLRLAFIHIILLILTLTSWVFGVIKLVNSPSLAVTISLLVVLFWTMHHFIPIVASIYLCLEKPRQRVSERMDVFLNMNTIIKNEEGKNTLGYFGKVVNLSDTGAKIKLHKNSDFNLDDKNKVFKLKIEQVGAVLAKIVRLYEQDNYKLIGIEFVSPNKTILFKINQIRFSKIKSCKETSYYKVTLIYTLSVILFKKFAFKKQSFNQ